MVDEEVEGIDFLVDRRGLGDFLRCDRDGVGDVGEACGCKGLRFGKSGYGEAAEVKIGLNSRRLDALVGFDMGSQGIWIGLLAGLTASALMLLARFKYLTQRLIRNE